MNPFDLEKALAGEPVETRWGAKVTQLSRIEYRGHNLLIGVIKREAKPDTICLYFENGISYNEETPDVDVNKKLRTSSDLFMTN